MQGRRPEADPRFTPHVSRFLEAGRARRRWSRVVRRSRKVNVGQAPSSILRCAAGRRIGRGCRVGGGAFAHQRREFGELVHPLV